MVPGLECYSGARPALRRSATVVTADGQSSSHSRSSTRSAWSPRGAVPGFLGRDTIRSKVYPRPAITTSTYYTRCNVCKRSAVAGSVAKQCRERWSSRCSRPGASHPQPIGARLARLVVLLSATRSSPTDARPRNTGLSKAALAHRCLHKGLTSPPRLTPFLIGSAVCRNAPYQAETPWSTPRLRS